MPETQTMLLKINLKHLRLPTICAEFEQAGPRGIGRQRGLRAVPAATDGTGGGGPVGQRPEGPHQAGRLPRDQGPRHLRLQPHAQLEQAEGPGTGPRGVDRPALQLPA